MTRVPLIIAVASLAVISVVVLSIGAKEVVEHSQSPSGGTRKKYNKKSSTSKYKNA